MPAEMPFLQPDPETAAALQRLADERLAHLESLVEQLSGALASSTAIVARVIAENRQLVRGRPATACGCATPTYGFLDD
jgi:hypothetical protein